MGYSTIQKGYLLLDLNSNKIYVNKDITFQEDVFLFSKIRGQNLSNELTQQYANNSDDVSSVISVELDDSFAINEDPSKDTLVFIPPVDTTKSFID